MHFKHFVHGYFVTLYRTTSVATGGPKSLQTYFNYFVNAMAYLVLGSMSHPADVGYQHNQQHT